ncbi:hypothetical protein [Streptomyces cinnamoneus]
MRLERAPAAPMAHGESAAGVWWQLLQLTIVVRQLEGPLGMAAHQ